MQDNTTYVGLDVHKKEIIGATLFPGQSEPEIWSIPNQERPLKRMIGRIMSQAPDFVSCCYEAGSCGFVVQRHVRSLGAECKVIAPSLIPRKPGDRIKTDRRDARKLVFLHRTDMLTEVIPPTPEEESVRALTRCREQAREDLMRCRHRLIKFLNQRGRIYSDGVHWTKKHRLWLKSLQFEHGADATVFWDYQLAVEHLEERIKTLEAHIEEISLREPYAAAVGRLRCFRGIDTTTAMVLVAELYAFARFLGPRELMAFLGLIPSEHTSGGIVKRGGITKAGNHHVRRSLIETAWHYRHAPLVGAALKKRREGQPAQAVAIADKARIRLCGRYKSLVRKGKDPNVAVVAVARELAGFLWATLVDLSLDKSKRPKEKGPLDLAG